MTDHKARPEQWDDCGAFASDTRACLLELRARVEVLEDAAQKHIVETSANILALASRIEALERFQQQPEPINEEENDRRFHACMDLIRNAMPEQIRAAAGLPKRSASKVYEINEPLKLTPEQAQQVRDLLAPEPRRNHPAKPDSSLVERVGAAIFEQFENNAGNEAEARAAIRVIAGELRAQCFVHAAEWLEQEAKR